MPSAPGRAIFARISLVAAGALLCAAPQCAFAQDPKATSFPFALDGVYHEIESKYIFGFTEGADIGAEGETAVESDTNAAFRKRHGAYNAAEQEVEFEGVPTQFFAYELSLHGVTNAIKGVDGYDDLHRSGFSGFSTNLRYLLLGRGPELPIGLTVMAEPEWARVDGDTGKHTRSFGSTFTLMADTELIENRLFLAGNLVYQPGFAKAVEDPAWSRAATLGARGAMAWRFTPTIMVGGEAEYYRAYDTLGFGAFQGNAFYLGPTLHVQLTKKIMLAGAFSAQVAGHASGDELRLDLVNFPRYRARLKLEYEF